MSLDKIIKTGNDYVKEPIYMVDKYIACQNVNNIGDILQFECVHVVDDNLTINEFKKIIKNYKFQLHIHGTIVCRYNFDILIELNEIQKVENTFIIKIPDYFIKNFVNVALDGNVLIKFDSYERNNFKDISIIYKTTHYETEQRQLLTKNKHEQIIQQVYKICEFNGDELKNECRTIGFKFTKGFFVVGSLDNIKNISLIFIGTQSFLGVGEKFNYDRAMLHSVAHIISDNMCYISFDDKYNYTCLTPESFSGACDLSIYKSYLFRINLYKANISTYDIYSISGNTINYGCYNTTIVYDSPYQ